MELISPNDIQREANFDLRLLISRIDRDGIGRCAFCAKMKAVRGGKSYGI